jgi:PST family polysaccharide transporter
MRASGSVGRLLTWHGASVLVQAGAQLGVTALLGRILGPTEFGLIAAANVVITLVQMLAEGGLGSAMARARTLKPALAGSALYLSLAVAAVSLGLVAAAAAPVEDFFAIPGLGDVMMVSALSFFPLAVAAILEGVLQRDLEFRRMLQINLATSVLGYAVPAAALALAGAGVWAIVLPNVFRFVFKAAVLSALLRKRIAWSWDRNEARALARFGFGLTQDRGWNWLFVQAAPTVVGRTIGQVALGSFYLGSQLGVLPSQYASNVISTVYMPIFARAARGGVPPVDILVPVWACSVAVLTMVGLFLAANAETVVAVLLGSQWGAAVPVFQVIALGSGIRAGIQVSDAFNVARGRVYGLAACRAVSAVVLAVLAAAVVRPYGLTGVSVAYVAAHALMLSSTTALALHGSGVEPGGARALRRPAFTLLVVLLSVALALLAIGEIGDIPAAATVTMGAVSTMAGIALALRVMKPWLQGGLPAPETAG